MKKFFAMLLAAAMLLCSVSAVAESAIGLTDWMADGNATGAVTPGFKGGVENRPSKEELTEMLTLANTYFQCHSLTGTHFVVIQDAQEQAEILSVFSQFVGLDTTGTVMVLVMADGVKDQEHHAASYYPGTTETNGGNPEYWNMYYGIYEAGWASGYLNLVARDMGYRCRAYAALSIPNAETGEVDLYGTGGNFAYIQGDNWDIEKYMTSEDGSESFDHYVMALDDTIPLEGNVTLLCAILIGSIDETDTASGATELPEKRMDNFDFWDWDDNYTPVTSAGMDMAGLPDGDYIGNGTNLEGTVSVTVTIADGKIAAIKLNEGSSVISSEDDINAFFAAVVAGQSTDVDTISGATTETNALKDAIALALSAAAAK